MIYKVYILQSLQNSKYYVGHTGDIENRIIYHNAGKVRSTKSGRPWKVIYTENYDSKSKAYQREVEIKGYKSGIKFKKLLGLWQD